MTIAMLLEMAASEFDDQIALTHGKDQWTYAELASASANGAANLSEHSARSLAFLGTNGPAMPIALFAAAEVGVPFVPLNYRLARAQLVELLERLDAPLIIADAAQAEILGDIGATVIQTPDWIDTIRKGSASQPDRAIGDESAAVILFTSGTTSKPKGVLLTHSNLVSYILQTVQFGGAEPTDASLISLPPYHIAGVGTVLSNIYSGRRMVYLTEFTPAQWIRLVRDEQVTNAMVVPTMLARLVEELESNPDNSQTIPNLRSIAYGGSRVSPVILERALAAFPAAGFVNAYGLTETSSTVAVLGPDDHRTAIGSDDPAVRARLGSVGQAVPGVEFAIRDDDDNPCAVGEIGELWIRGPQVSGGYLEAGSVLDADGWFPTRDRAWLDSDGYLFIEGRADDTIIRGGENIAPAEIEDVISTHPGVHDVAVIGLPDDEWGQRTVAVVVVDPGTQVDPQELRDFVRARLRGSRTPDDVLFRDELPYTSTGKLLRRQLVDELKPA
jgi:acyl-CoA synthetase (AMP-forming)/AMP-acid ligase II